MTFTAEKLRQDGRFESESDGQSASARAEDSPQREAASCGRK